MADDAREAFWWFGPDTATELARRIADAGADIERVEVRIDRTRRGEPMTFRVVRKAETIKAESDLNDTWLCPPICPGGGGGG